MKIAQLSTAAYLIQNTVWMAVSDDDGFAEPGGRQAQPGQRCHAPSDLHHPLAAHKLSISGHIQQRVQQKWLSRPYAYIASVVNAVEFIR